MNAGRGHQAPRKAAHSLQKEVGQNIKDKQREKRVRDRDPSWQKSSCLQSFPASRSFQMSQFSASGDQSIGASASASVLPMNIQD